MKKPEFITQVLRLRLQDGVYHLRAFPSERQLAKEFGVGYMTARAAVQKLVESGDLVRSGKTTKPAASQNQGAGPTFLFVVPNWNNPNYWLWYPILDEAVRGINGTLRFVVYQDWSDPVIFETLQQPADGIFLFVYPGVPELILKQLERAAGRVATFYDDYSDRGIYCLNYFPAEGTDLLVGHLRDLGHTRIDCFNTQPHSADEAWRISSWRKAIDRLGLEGELLDFAVTPGADARQAAYRLALSRMRKGEGFAEAIYCTSAMTAIGLCRAAYELGRRVGVDLSVCTPGMYETCRYLTPSITCLITGGLNYHAERVVQAMLHRNTGGALNFSPQTAELYFGESTGPAASRRSVTVS